DPAGQQDLHLLELRRVEQLVEERADRDAALAGVGGALLLRRQGVVRVVELGRRRLRGAADDRVVRRALAEVDALLVAAELVAERAGRGDVLGDEVRLPAVDAGRSEEHTSELQSR